MANECVDSWRRLGLKGLICKIDLEKAFYKVD